MNSTKNNNNLISKSYVSKYDLVFLSFIIHLSCTDSFILYLSADVLSNRKLLCRLLHHKGMHTAQAKDGREALRMVACAPNVYDLVFMDNTMPEMVCRCISHLLLLTGFIFMISMIVQCHIILIIRL